ncbi:MAG: AmmeMemoRadiSam system radical SAM enzyme [Chloroflexi bacterium]|nr:AmmeMemoRadiSam system radical SAM enzyme [Chloroflexota bacterium]
MNEARLYIKLDEQRVRCALCAHRCQIKPGDRGICQVRENRDGILYSLVYGKAISAAVDPIEKKPLFHFKPGSNAFSVATAGCNFKCSFCQNADISQMPRDRNRIEGNELFPELVVRGALAQHCASIAYTYTEPTVFYEYAYDISVLAREKGIANVWVSNGYMTPEVLNTLTDSAPLLDAANIDLKAFQNSFYQQQCGARLQPVLDTLLQLKKRNVWLEVTTLIIPRLNDSEEELQELAHFIAHELGKDTPWHVSRFHPMYRLQDHERTPIETLHRAYQIGKAEGLDFVYVGNLAGDEGEHTRCPTCHNIIIRRTGYTIRQYHLQEGRCGFCNTVIPGVGL